VIVLEIELLTGVYRAALPDNSGAEWPPHPERVFSALAQAWGDGGSNPAERAALEWLEAQKAPSIEADGEGEWYQRSAPTVFVPPNDARGADIAVLPDRRPRQARSFRAAVPFDPLIRMLWTDTVPTPQDRTALDTLALRVASLGHSSSLVRFAFKDETPVNPQRVWQPALDGRFSLRVPHQGRLARLERWLRAQERPGLGVNARYRAPGEAPDSAPVQSIFGGEEDWFVFEDAGGFRPDLLGFAQVAKRVRDSLMALGPKPTPEILSGHTKEGGATAKPHVAVVPLANAGWDHATGDLLGFAIVLPRDVAREERGLALEAVAKFAGLSREHMSAYADAEASFARLNFGAAGVWRLEQTAAPSRRSLQSTRWCESARTWASVTPILLDRFPDHGDAVAEGELVGAACRNIGLPEPVEIELHKHPAIKGVPSAYPSHGGRQPDWSFPAGARFASRPRRHVILRFSVPVSGPVILGAGRYHGFGLCLPLDAENAR
jgi:CRISPR-associated protein Csb2